MSRRLGYVKAVSTSCWQTISTSKVFNSYVFNSLATLLYFKAVVNNNKYFSNLSLAISTIFDNMEYSQSKTCHLYHTYVTASHFPSVITSNINCNTQCTVLLFMPDRNYDLKVSIPKWMQ